MDKVLFTSESVTEGHPDKICDQISDAILDALLEQDPMSRVACETCTTTGIVMVMGEISTKAYVDIQKIVRDTVREIGYTRGKYGFDAVCHADLIVSDHCHLCDLFFFLAVIYGKFLTVFLIDRTNDLIDSWKQ